MNLYITSNYTNFIIDYLTFTKPKKMHKGIINRLIRKLRNYFMRNRVMFLAEDGNLAKGYLVHYVVHKRQSKAKGEAPILAAIIEPDYNLGNSLKHVLVSAANVELIR